MNDDAVLAVCSAWQEGDACVARIESPWFFLPGPPRRWTCLLLANPGVTASPIEGALREGRAFTLIAALARVTWGAQLEQQQEIGSDKLQDLAEHTDFLLAEAYDGAAFLIWSAPGQKFMQLIAGTDDETPRVTLL